MASRRMFLKSAGMAAAALSLSRTNYIAAQANKQSAAEAPFISKQKEKTNIILILADDLGQECLSCYGNTAYQTPNLDQMAAQGVQFTDCHATPLCTPSRVKIMTGQYNFRNYVEFGVLRKGEKTFAHLFKAYGYATCCAGKWQLNARKEGQTPSEAGFDEHCLWQVNIAGERYHTPTFTRNGEPVREMQGQYGPDVESDFICDFMERKKDQPFFVYYPMCLPHAPFEPTPDSPEWPEKMGMQDARFYKDMALYMDKLVGKIVQKTETLEIADKTLILFTADNGSPTGITTATRKGLVRGGKGTTSDAGTRVPLIAFWKNHSGFGDLCTDLIDFTDVLPTLADAAGIPIPADWTVDGNSFLPQIYSLHNPRWKSQIFVYFDPRIRQPWSMQKWVRGKRFKLYDDGRFYDIQTDVREEYPLKQEALSPWVCRLRDEYQKILNHYKDVRAPYLHPDGIKRLREKTLNSKENK